MNELYCSRSEAAKILGVSMPTIRNLVHRGELKAVSIPSGKRQRYFFAKEDIKRLKKEQEKNALNLENTEYDYGHNVKKGENYD